MKLVIPMAGFGSRMRPHTWTRPKPLLPLAGQPMLARILDCYAGVPIEEYVFITGWLGNQIETYVQENLTLPARFVQQTELLGQAHAIWLAREHLEGPIFLMWVDTWFAEADLTRLDEPGVDGVIYTYEVDDPRRFGVVATDAQGWVTHLVEKPESSDNRTTLIGVYYFRDGAWLARACEALMERRIQTKGEYYLADAINLMLEQGARIKTRPVGVWLDTGKPETTLLTHRYVLEHGADNSFQTPRPGVAIIPPVFIHSEALVERSVIGPYVSIGKGAKVQDSILRDAIVDDGAEVNAELLEESLVGRWTSLAGHFQKINLGDSSKLG